MLLSGSFENTLKKEKGASCLLKNLITYRREIRDTCMENMTFIQDEMYLLSDNSVMLKVDKRSLRTIGQVRWYFSV